MILHTRHVAVTQLTLSVHRLSEAESMDYPINESLRLSGRQGHGALSSLRLSFIDGSGEPFGTLRTVRLYKAPEESETPFIG